MSVPFIQGVPVAFVDHIAAFLHWADYYQGMARQPTIFREGLSALLCSQIPHEYGVVNGGEDIIKNILQDAFPAVFAPLEGLLPQRHGYDFEINLKDDAQPIKVKMYPIPVSLEPELREQLNHDLLHKWITTTQSQFASPILFVKKKNGKWRMCVDYRKFNKITKDDTYPIPNLKVLLNKTKGANIKFIMDQRETTINARNSRWLEKIDTYSPELQIIKGKENVVADGLSRGFNDERDRGELKQVNQVDNSITTRERLLEDYDERLTSLLNQEEDLDDSRDIMDMDELNSCMIFSEHQLLPKIIKGYEIEDENVINGSFDQYEGKEIVVHENLRWMIIEDGYKVIVPLVKSVIKQVINHHHDSILAGHWNHIKTRELIKRNFIWENMNKDIESYCKSCHICIRSI